MKDELDTDFNDEASDAPDHQGITQMFDDFGSQCVESAQKHFDQIPQDTKDWSSLHVHGVYSNGRWSVTFASPIIPDLIAHYIKKFTNHTFKLTMKEPDDDGATGTLERSADIILTEPFDPAFYDVSTFSLPFFRQLLDNRLALVPRDDGLLSSALSLSALQQQLEHPEGRRHVIHQVSTPLPSNKTVTDSEHAAIIMQSLRLTPPARVVTLHHALNILLDASRSVLTGVVQELPFSPRPAEDRLLLTVPLVEAVNELLAAFGVQLVVWCRASAAAATTANHTPSRFDWDSNQLMTSMHALIWSMRVARCSVL